MYPLNLELQYQQYFVEQFRKKAIPFTREIIKKLREEIKADSDNSIRADSTANLVVFIQGLKKKYKKGISEEKLSKEVESQFQQINAWSRSKAIETTKKNYERLSEPQPPSVTGRPTPAGKAGELWMQTVNVQNNIGEELINKTVKRNVSLINKAHEQHFEQMTEIVKQGILRGEGHLSISQKLMQETGVGESKAKFWARDQASKFSGEITKIRQQAAGNKGYIWRCFKDNVTRDSHMSLDGTYQDWNNPPTIRRGKGTAQVHPGEDYNCRCWAEPASDESAAENRPIEHKQPVQTAVNPKFQGLASSSFEGNETDGVSTIINVEPINIKDKKLIREKFDNFADQYKGEKIEYALVISVVQGKAITIKGSTGTVNPGLIGKENLRGAKVIHNHPDESGFLGDCFSVWDLNDFFKFEMAELEVVSGLGHFFLKLKKRLSQEQIKKIVEELPEVYRETRNKIVDKLNKKNKEMDYEQLRVMEKLTEKYKNFIEFKIKKRRKRKK